MTTLRQYFNGGPKHLESRDVTVDRNPNGTIDIPNTVGVTVNNGTALYHLRWFEGRRVQGPQGYEYDWRGEYV